MNYRPSDFVSQIRTNRSAVASAMREQRATLAGSYACTIEDHGRRVMIKNYVVRRAHRIPSLWRLRPEAMVQVAIGWENTYASPPSLRHLPCGADDAAWDCIVENYRNALDVFRTFGRPLP